MSKYVSRILGICLAMVVCAGDAHADRNAYVECTNNRMVSTAQELGISTTTRPTKAQIRRVQQALDKKCGHLKNLAPNQLPVKNLIEGYWQGREAGKVYAVHGFKAGAYDFQLLVMVDSGAPALIHQGSYRVIGREIHATYAMTAPTTLASNKRSQHILRLESPTCLKLIAMVVDGRRQSVKTPTCLHKTR